MKEQQKKFKNSFHLRVRDIELVKSMEELIATGNYDSMNELLNCALGIGIEKIYLEYGKRKLFSKPLEIPERPDRMKIDGIEKEVKQSRLLQEDMFILLNSVEALVASIYNVHRATLKGEPLNEEILDSGYMISLPEAYQAIKDKTVERFNRRLSKEKKDE